MLKRLSLMVLLSLVVVSVAQAADHGFLPALGLSNGESKQLGLQMQTSGELPMPELVGFKAAELGHPAILELEDGSASLKIVWRDSHGQVVKRPGDYVVSAFSENGLESVQLAMRSADVLRLTPRRHGAEWMTVVVRLRNLPISWAASCWVSWGDYHRISRNEQLQLQMPNANATAVDANVGIAVNAP